MLGRDVFVVGEADLKVTNVYVLASSPCTVAGERLKVIRSNLAQFDVRLVIGCGILCVENLRLGFAAVI